MAASGVHVLGAGSIGLLFAAQLAKAGVHTTLLLRNSSQLATFAAIRNRITVERPNGAGKTTTSTFTVSGEVAASLPLECSSSGIMGSGQAQIRKLIVTTKANHAVQALRAVKHRLCRDSVVLLLQNGVLGVYMEALAEVFPQSTSRPAFLLGSTTHGSFRVSDFHIMHASSGQGTCVFGLPSKDMQAAAQQAAPASQPGKQTNRSVSSSSSNSCSTAAHNHHQQQGSKQQQAAGAEDSSAEQQQQQQQQQHVQEMLAVLESLQPLQPNTQFTAEELEQQLLLKLLINCCANPMTALLHCRNGGLCDNPYAETVWRGVVQEAKQVFGEKLPGTEQELFAKVSHVVRINATNYNSMLQDVIRRQHTEVDYMNGYVVRQGAAQGVATPWNSMLVTMVKARETCPHPMLTSEAM